MSRVRFSDILSLLFLLLLQVLIFNRIHFLGYASPMVYLLFVMKYPYEQERLGVMLLSFLLGLGIDIFSDTGGIFATSILIVSYIRPLILRFCFGKNLEYQRIRLLNFPFMNLLLYISIIVILNNTFFYFLEAFNFAHIWDTIVKILVSSALTIVICILSVYLVDRRKS